MNVKERIKKFIEHKNLPICKFEDECGLSNGYIAAMRKGFGEEKLNNVLRAFPDLNREWLLYGEGDMIKIPATMTIYKAAPEEANTDGLDVSVLPTNIVEEIKEEAIEEIKAEEQVPIISRTVPTSQINVREYIDKNSDELDRIDPAKLLNNPDVAEQVTGASMLPTFAAGDVVFIKFLPDKAQMIDGKLYYFDLVDLPTMIRRVKFEGEDKVRLIAKNPAFADIVLERSRILNIGKVVGMFRSTFSDQYDEIENVRREQSGRIDRLIEQNNKALDSIGELISVIKNK